ncbi:MAG: calcium-binding protein, partial [Moorea sp. SIO3I7]|nr:calcium-binding protein [Moorena sp. SIO3I7]
SNNPYYVGGGGVLGINDYAQITDFQSGTDKIQLKSGINYIFGANFIAVNQGVSSLGTSSLASVQQVANNIALGNSSAVQSQFNIGNSFNSVDIIAIVSGGYNQIGDLSFV